MHSEQHCAASRPEGVAHTTCINRQLSVGGATFVSCSQSRCWWIENKAQRSGGCVCPQTVPRRPFSLWCLPNPNPDPLVPPASAENKHSH